MSPDSYVAAMDLASRQGRPLDVGPSAIPNGQGLGKFNAVLLGHRPTISGGPGLAGYSEPTPTPSARPKCDFFNSGVECPGDGLQDLDIAVTGCALGCIELSGGAANGHHTAYIGVRVGPEIGFNAAATTSIGREAGWQGTVGCSGIAGGGLTAGIGANLHPDPTYFPYGGVATGSELGCSAGLGYMWEW